MRTLFNTRFWRRVRERRLDDDVHYARIVLAAPEAGEIVKDVLRPTTLIGRRPGCNIQLVSVEVAPTHCLLTLDAGVLRVRDLRSISGVLVNGDRVELRVLGDGDRLQIGPFQGRIETNLPSPSDAEVSGDAAPERGSQTTGPQQPRVLSEKENTGCPFPGDEELVEAAGTTSPSFARLTITAPDGCVIEKDVWRHTTLVGRLPGCNIQLVSEQIAPLHCAITLDDGTFRVHDLRTRTAIRVNGARVEASALANGDLLEIGPFHVRFKTDFSPPREKHRSHGDEVVSESIPTPSADPPHAERDPLGHQLQDLAAERERLAHEQQNVLEERRQLETERQQWREQVQRESEDLEQHRAETLRLEQSDADLEARLRQFDEDQAALARAVEAHERSCRDLEEQQRQLHAQRNSLDEDRTALESLQDAVTQRESQLAQDVSAFHNERSRHAQAWEQAIQYAAHLARSQAALNYLHDSIRHDQETLTAEIARLEVEKKACEDGQNRLKQQRALLAAEQIQLEQDRETASQQVAHLQNEFRSLEARRADLRAESLRMEAIRAQLTDDRKGLQREQEHLRDQAAFVETQQERLRLEQQRISEALAEVDRASESVEGQRRALAAELRKFEAGKLQLQSELDDLRCREQEFNGKIAAFEEQRAGFEQQQELLSRDKSELERQSQEIQAERSDVESARVELDSQRRQVELLEAQLEERERLTQQQNEALDVQLKQTADARAVVDREAAELAAERNILREQQDQLQKERHKLQLSRERLQTEIGRRRDDPDQRLQQIEQTRRELENEKETLQSEWQMLRAEHDRVRREADSLQEAKQHAPGRSPDEVDRQQRAAIARSTGMSSAAGFTPVESEVGSAVSPAEHSDGGSAPVNTPEQFTAALSAQFRDLQNRHKECCSERDDLEAALEQLERSLEQLSNRQRRFQQRVCQFESDRHLLHPPHVTDATVADEWNGFPCERRDELTPVDDDEEERLVQAERARLKAELRHFRQARRRFQQEIAVFQRRVQRASGPQNGRHESNIPLSRNLKMLAQLQEEFDTTRRRLQKRRTRLCGELHRFWERMRRIDAHRRPDRFRSERSASGSAIAADTLLDVGGSSQELSRFRARLLSERSGLAAERNALESALERLTVRLRELIDEKLASFDVDCSRLLGQTDDAMGLLEEIKTGLAALRLRQQELPASLAAIASGCDACRIELRNLKKERRRFRKALKTLQDARQRFDEVAAKLQPGDTDFAIARSLVVHGLVNRNQADWFLKGRFDGYSIGDYEVVGHLDSRAFGWLYKARDPKSGRRVALKVLSERYAGDPEIAARFEIEARIGCRLTHPHIVHTLAYSSGGEVPSLAMEFIEGINLRELVELHGPLDVDQACDLAVQAASGLQHMHERGMVHRDVKPSNLLITSDGRLKLLDFGLTLVADDEDEFSLAMIFGHNSLGTADYVAPEQVCDSFTVDARADLYSLGSTLFFALTGTVPFSGQSVIEKLESHGTGRVPNICDLAAGIPARLGRVVSRLMAGNPDERYPTAADAARDLRRWGRRGPAYFNYRTVLAMRAAQTRRRLYRKAAAIRKGQNAAELTDIDSVTRPLTQSTVDDR